MEPAQDQQQTPCNNDISANISGGEFAAQGGQPGNGELWDRALVLLLEREEALLRDIVFEFGCLAQTAQKQTWEMVDFIEGGT